MKKNEPIAKIMSSDVVAIQAGQKLSEVRHLMAEGNIHHVPVLEGRKLVGLVSFTDMMKLNFVISGADERTIDTIIDQQFDIRAIMSTRLVTLPVTASVREASELLAKGEFHSLPVVDADDQLAGIVTSTDLIRYLNDQY